MCDSGPVLPLLLLLLPLAAPPCMLLLLPLTSLSQVQDLAVFAWAMGMCLHPTLSTGHPQQVPFLCLHFLTNSVVGGQA